MSLLPRFQIVGAVSPDEVPGHEDRYQTENGRENLAEVVELQVFPYGHFIDCFTGQFWRATASSKAKDVLVSCSIVLLHFGQPILAVFELSLMPASLRQIMIALRDMWVGVDVWYSTTTISRTVRFGSSRRKIVVAESPHCSKGQRNFL